jgi:hypothetical protein
VNIRDQGIILGDERMWDEDPGGLRWEGTNADSDIAPTAANEPRNIRIRVFQTHLRTTPAMLRL